MKTNKVTMLTILAVCTIMALGTIVQAGPVKLTEVTWQKTGCYKIEMPMGTVYFEKDNGVSGFKSFVDPEGNDWISSYYGPGPNSNYRGFPNSIGNFGHAGRDSGSTTIVVDGKTEGDCVILESSNKQFTFQYWFFADHISIKVLKSEGDYCFLLEGVAGGTADAEDFFVTADGKKHIPTADGEFDDFTPEWVYLGDPKVDTVMFLAKTPEDDAPNENHRQVKKGKINMDLYSFGRAGQEHKYKVSGMSGNEHVCIIGFASAKTKHEDMGKMIEGFLAKPFSETAKPAKNTSASKTKSLIVEAESGTFTGKIESHSCWQNVMLTDAPHSTHSGRASIDTVNEVGSYIEVDYEATWSGPHRITARYTHIKPDPRPGELLVNGKVVATLKMQQSEALTAWKTESTVVNLKAGKNIIHLRALNEGGLPNMDCIKVAEVRDIPAGTVPRIKILEAEEGRHSGKEDHHSCWNFIAQIQADHSDYTGEGLVDTLNEVGSYIEVTFDSATAGRHTLGVRYVHGKPDTRPAEVKVNGFVANASLEFKTTVAWTAWTTITIPVDLQAGRNVIRLTALGDEGLTNIDHFELTPVAIMQ